MSLLYLDSMPARNMYAYHAGQSQKQCEKMFAQRRALMDQTGRCTLAHPPLIVNIV